MNIIIKKLNEQEINSNTSDIIITYLVAENSKEFTIICKSNLFGRSFMLAGKEGTLYIDREDNRVHLQKVALGGGCGLLIDDEPVEGLSPAAIRGVIIAEDHKDTREIMITDDHHGDHSNKPVIFINGNIRETSLLTHKDNCDTE